MRYCRWVRAWIAWAPLPVWTLAFVSGCAGPPTPVESFERGPLPYHVCVFVDRERLGFAAAEKPDETSDGTAGGNGGAELPATEPEKVRCTLDEATLAAQVARDLSTGSGAVSLARVIEAASRSDAMRIAQSANADLLVAIGFETRPEYQDPSWGFGWGSLEIASWLFGGIPAWFVPSLDFTTLSRLKVELVDLRRGTPGREHSEPETAWKQDFDAPIQNVSLWDRSYPFDRPLDYLATIIVPPFAMQPGDPARLSAELTGDLSADLNGQLAGSLREHLIESERTAPLSVAFLSPDPADELAEETSIRLRVAVASRGPGRVAAFDIHRFASGAEKFRWILPQKELQEVFAQTASLEVAPNDYVIFDVPADIPIVPGENIIKVRVLRDDGFVVTRTMVYRAQVYSAEDRTKA